MIFGAIILPLVGLIITGIGNPIFLISLAIVGAILGAFVGIASPPSKGGRSGGSGSNWIGTSSGSSGSFGGGFGGFSGGGGGFGGGGASGGW